MDFSRFGKKFSAGTGILALMDDLGKAMEQGGDIMLGGGNPAHIPQINRIWRRRMEEILATEGEFERMVANYDTPQGRYSFLEALAELINREYGWGLSAKNIAVTNSSQSAFFFLLNMFSGTFDNDKKKKILFPLTPEYIGYADQAAEADAFLSYPSKIEFTGENSFKYHVDFSKLEITEEVGAICVSRPTNPTGNVLTDEEVQHLAGIAEEHSVPLLLDNAYGTPFPQIIFVDVKPVWNENIVLGMSLSKLGLPSVRTGIVIAREEIIEAVSSMNAIVSLASGALGQVLTLPLIKSGEILKISREIINPYYRRKSHQVLYRIRESFEGLDYAVHENEGTFFLWIWFKKLPITTRELYERLKRRGVLVVPGCYFFFGLKQPWAHRDECIRVNYSQDDNIVNRGIEIIADEVRAVLKKTPRQEKTSGIPPATGWEKAPSRT
ncbi:MAG: valine--pyruvate transaminase [Spirochaetes bacterium]|nr:MAG: valine--pyruvate transaminase [Spirochaetota bacterium]